MGQIELAILKAAQAGGYLEKLPEDPEDIIKEANFYLAEATKAYEEDGMKGDKAIKEIINLGKKLGAQTDEEIFGSDKPEVFRGLPVPENPRHDPTPLPVDFTELSPKEIRRLHAEYNAYAARARWMLAVTTNKLAGVVHLRDAEYRSAYKQIHEDNVEKKLTQPLLEAAAKQTEEYVKLDNKASIYQTDVNSYKALAEIYVGNVERLSREWTMRQDEDRNH